MLTAKQTEVIKHFWKKGSFLSDELRAVYTSDISISSCIQRLQALGLVEFNGRRYEIKRERYLIFQKYNE